MPATETKDFDEKVLELLAVVLAEEADCTEVRVLIRGKVTESDVTFKETDDFRELRIPIQYPKTWIFSIITG
nr:hypothetical protein [Natrinema sp. CBA1119]